MIRNTFCEIIYCDHQDSTHYHRLDVGGRTRGSAESRSPVGAPSAGWRAEATSTAFATSYGSSAARPSRDPEDLQQSCATADLANCRARSKTSESRYTGHNHRHRQATQWQRKRSRQHREAIKAGTSYEVIEKNVILTHVIL